MFPETHPLPVPGQIDSPLTHARVSSGLLHQEESAAALEAAENLLSKASARLAAGDRSGARGFVRRALALPFDEFEHVHPATWWLVLEMSTRLSEEVELAAQDDSRWVQRAELLLAGAGAVAAAVIRCGLGDVLAEFPLVGEEQRRVLRMVDGAPFERDPFAAITDPDALCLAALDVLGALNRQSDLLAEDLRGLEQHEPGGR